MNECGGKAFREADKKLNEAYGQIVNRLRDGRIVSMQSYQSKRRALEQAGGAELVARVAS